MVYLYIETNYSRVYSYHVDKCIHLLVLNAFCFYLKIFGFFQKLLLFIENLHDLNPLLAKASYLNCHPLKVVSHCRDPVAKKYSETKHLQILMSKNPFPSE